MWHDVELVAGFHSPEQDELGPFIWSTGTFQRPAPHRLSPPADLPLVSIDCLVHV